LLSAIAMRRALAIVFASAVVLSANAPATPALTIPPADPAVSLDDRAGMCDAFEGLAFTFCVALCEARACDLLDGDDERCALLRDGFATASGGAAAPCADAASTTSLRAS
jgi:hypothetical protein